MEQRPKLIFDPDSPFLNGGGSGGTTNYNQLRNRPSIEGVTLEGDKTFEELNLHTITHEEIDEITNIGAGDEPLVISCQGFGVCETASGTSAKTVEIEDFNLAKHSIVAVLFQNAVPANATLNINGTGAKAIYLNNSAIAGGIIGAGNICLFMYDGSYYRLLTVEDYIAKAPIASPALTGTPTAPTASTGNSSTQIATTAFVNNEIANDVLTPMHNAGVFEMDHANWNNANTVLLVTDAYNGSIYKVAGTAGTVGTNYPDGLPSDLQNRTMVAMRTQFAGRAVGSTSLHAVVVLYEVYPVNGRIWTNSYNVSWGGWKYINPVPGTNSWFYSGKLIDAVTDTSLAGYGVAQITLMPDGIYQINFQAKIDVAGTTSNDFTAGIDATIFTSLVGRTLTALTIPNSGFAQIFNSSGALKTSMMGYGLQMRKGSANRWTFGRKYAQSGSDFGLWATTLYAVGDIICGMCYAT